MDAERTLQGLKTFLDRVSRAARVHVVRCHLCGAYSLARRDPNALTKALDIRDAAIMSRFHELLPVSAHHRGRAFKRAADTRPAMAVHRTVRRVPHALVVRYAV